MPLRSADNTRNIATDRVDLNIMSDLECTLVTYHRTMMSRESLFAIPESLLRKHLRVEKFMISNLVRNFEVSFINEELYLRGETSPAPSSRFAGNARKRTYN